MHLCWLLRILSLNGVPICVALLCVACAVFTVTMVATVELGHVPTPQRLVSSATIAVRVAASQLVAQISGGDRSFWCANKDMFVNHIMKMLDSVYFR